MSHSSDTKKLGWFLCWAVVFADIGTSLYYVPGILFGEVRNLSGLFVMMSSVVFVLLTMKYIEITDRYAEGGGVVTVANKAFGPWMGAFGGMLITVDYFLTASLSSVSGFAYLNSLIHLGSLVPLLAIAGIMFLGVLNIIGIQESAGVTAVVAVGAFIVDIILLALVATQVGPEGWSVVFHSITQVTELKPVEILTGFAGSFLAFSGLESISQLSPAMQTPRKKVASIAMALVVVAILLTAPLLTLFSTNLLTAKIPGTDEAILESVSNIKHREAELVHVTDPAEREELEHKIIEGREYSERFMSELGAQYGGPLLKFAVVLTASVLLLFAANTAIIGAYHVFITLARMNFLPKQLLAHNTKFGTPHWSVALDVIPPILIIFATQGNVILLGQLYAFGLLGAFTLSSLGLDAVRWKEKPELSLNFVLGVITTILVIVAWITNLYFKQKATIFGGAITLVGMIIAYLVNKYQTPELVDVTVETDAQEMAMKQGAVYVPVFDEFDPEFFEFVGDYAKHRQKEVVLMYIREFTDVLQTVSENIKLDKEAGKFLKRAHKIMGEHRVKTHLLYRATTDAADVINETRSDIQPSITILSPHQNSLVLDFFKGNILKKVLTHRNGNVLVYTQSQKNNPRKSGTPNKKK